VTARVLAALPLATVAMLLAAGGAPFYWPFGIALFVVASVLVPLRASLTAFGALLWMIAGAGVPVMWVRTTTTDPRLALSAALLLSSVAAVRLFFERPLLGRGLDRALAILACVAVGIGAKSPAYPYGTVVLVAALLAEQSGGVDGLRSWARVPRAATGVVALSALLATLAALLLPMLDRATHRRFQSLFTGGLPRTSFTPHVRLDESGFIRTDDDIVLRLHGAEADYLRGAVFDAFDGTYWSTSTQGARSSPGATTAGRPTEVDATEATQWLFAPRGARIVSDTEWETDSLGALRPHERGVKQWAFAPTSDAVDEPSALDLTVPPSLSRRLRDLALAWTAGAEGDRARAQALERHLRQDFAYALERPRVPRGQSVLLDFLLVHREGHCEFFASAFVVLARVLGIPARLVAGYRVVEHNGFGGYAVVRAKHAHAWAEAYVPSASGPERAAFEVFDPTPAASGLVDSRPRTVAAFFDYLWTSLVAFYDAAVASPERSILALGGVALVAFVLRAVRNRRRRGVRPEADVDPSPAVFRRFELRLAKEGLVRDPAETLESFASRLALGGREALSRALRRYAKARYGARDTSEGHLARALEGVGEEGASDRLSTRP
jgi:transglutaminase-like putative cysteine protease